jgi:hypothetical protein
MATAGYCASKREYFYGLKVSLMVTKGGQPVEILLALGKTTDIVALRSMDMNLPEDSTLLGDSDILDRSFEEALAQEAGIRLIVPRRKNRKEQLEGCTAFVCQYWREQVESTFSQLAERFARSIHVVTAKGFELKVFLTVLAFSLVG